MRIKGDISGIDKLEKIIDETVVSTLCDVGKEATLYAKRSGTYQDRTGDLRNANGFCIVIDGKVVKMGVETDGSHPHAVEETENLMIYSEKPSDGLYLANGKSYASHVESKGYVVLTSAKLYAQRRAIKKMKLKRR